MSGYYSVRDARTGSWFIQALCRCLDTYGKSLDILKILTRMNKVIAEEYEINLPNQEIDKKKQIACITSMLTKDFYLYPKSRAHDGLPQLPEWEP